MRTAAFVFGSVMTNSEPMDHRLLADSQFARGQIQLLPLQGRQLSQPQSCGKFQQEQLVVRFLLRMDQLLHGFEQARVPAL